MAEATGASGGGANGAGAGQGGGAAAGTTGQPSTGPQAGAGQGGAQGQGGQPGEGQRATGERKAAAPIPPEEVERRRKLSEQRAKEKTKRENLLGFNVRDESKAGDEFPDLMAEARAPRRPKGPDGKFLSDAEIAAQSGQRTGAPPKPGEEAGKSAEGEAGKTNEGAPPQTPEQQAAAAAAGKVKFLGKDLTVPEIEQQHKTLQGNFRTVTSERDEAWKAGWAWKDAHDKVAAELAALKGSGGAGAGASASGVTAATGAAGSAAATGQPAGASGSAAGLPSVDELVAGIDGAAFEALAATKGVPFAVQFLAGEILKTVTDKMLPALEAKQAEQLRPVLSENERVAAIRQAGTIIEQVAALRLPDGSEAFPELKDGDTLQAIGEVARAYGLDQKEVMGTHRGLMAAVGLYRTIAPRPQPAGAAPAGGGNGAGNGAGAGNGSPAQTPAPGPAASLPASAGSFNGGQSEGGGRMIASRTYTPEQQRLINALEQAELTSKTPKGVDLGFARNRQPRA